MSRQAHPVVDADQRSSMRIAVRSHGGALQLEPFDLAVAMLDRVVAGKCFGRGDGHGSDTEDADCWQAHARSFDHLVGACKERRAVF